MGLGRLLLRATIGTLFVGHGLQKLTGRLGGGGLEGTGRFFEQVGLKPGRRHALAAGAAETGGGALLAAGLATPLAGAVLSGVMLTAIERVHWKRGVWNTDGGYEYNAVLLAALFELVERGPGRLSLDHARGAERTGLGWAIGALGAGAAGATAAALTARRAALEETASEATTRETETVSA